MKNGLMSGGRRSIARRMMKRCVAQLQADAGAGTSSATMLIALIALTILTARAPQRRRIMQVYYQRDGQPHASPFRAGARAHAARARRPWHDHGAGRRVQRA